VKLCLNIFAKIVADLKILKMLDDIALFRNTVVKKINEIADDVGKQILQSMALCS
jgi:hypothetical protein